MSRHEGVDEQVGARARPGRCGCGCSYRRRRLGAAASSARAFEDISALVEADPQAARARLSRYLEPVVLTPVQDEETGELVYDFDITLKNDSASLVGGRVYGLDGCGGLQPRRP